MTVQRRSIGIIGCGAIGSELAVRIQAKMRTQARVVAVYDIDSSRMQILARSLRQPGLACKDVSTAIKRSDIIIEATHARSSYEIVRQVLSQGKDVLVLSVGGIVNRCPALIRIASAKKANLFIPSGALAGLDGLKAAAVGKVKRVVLTTRKPVWAFSGVPYIARKRIQLSSLKGEKLLFHGNVLEAVKAFPQNINVAATLSLAGIGPRKTLVRIIADSAITCNVHEVTIESESGTIITRSENTVHPRNPKTSMLAVLSAESTLRQMFSVLRVGT